MKKTHECLHISVQYISIVLWTHSVIFFIPSTLRMLSTGCEINICIFIKFASKIKLQYLNLISFKYRGFSHDVTRGVKGCGRRWINELVSKLVPKVVCYRIGGQRISEFVCKNETPILSDER